MAVLFINTKWLFNFYPRYFGILRSLGILGFLFLIIGSVIYLIQPVELVYQLEKKQPGLMLRISSKKQTQEEPVNDVHVQNLDTNNSDYRGETIATSSLLLEDEGEKKQRTNTTIAGKVDLCEQEPKQEKYNADQQQRIQLLKEEKEILKANLTVYREVLSYMLDALRNTPYPGVENYTRYTVARLGMRPLSSAEQLKLEIGPVINDVLSFRYRLSVPCETITTTNRSVFIAVISAPHNFDRRRMIRQTWLNNLKLMKPESSMGLSGFAFILGLVESNVTQNMIDEESKTFGDIIQIEISDFYRNLSLKVVGLLNWLYRNCANADFVMKVDDDVYVNVRNLAHFVQSYHPSDKSIFGTSASPFIPNRDGKWAITFEEWPWSQYPPYFMGPAILMPQSTILPLLAASQSTPMVPFDDLYLTGMCTERAGIKLQFSTYSFSVVRKIMPAACDLHRVIAWLTSNQNLSHETTNDFYLNTTSHKCTDSYGVSTTADHNEPAHFRFDLSERK